MRVFSKSDIGKVRSSNQDSYSSDCLSNESAWVIVCDGMGGANGGDIASQMAVDSIGDSLRKNYKDGMDSKSVEDLLKESVCKANDEIYKKSLEDSRLNGMGTTVVLALVISDVLHIVYAGDSRAYIMNGENVTQITTDHSFVQQMVKIGQITESEAKDHPNRNIITRALGVSEKIQPDYIKYDLKDNDKVLVCTDGLSNYLDTETIFDFYKNFPTEVLVEKLISKAKDMGGSDNITAVMIDREIG